MVSIASWAWNKCLIHAIGDMNVKVDAVINRIAVHKAFAKRNANKIVIAQVIVAAMVHARMK